MMSKEDSQKLTEVSKSVVSLKEYFDKQLEAAMRNVESKLEGIATTAIVRHEALSEATKIKAETLERRFDNTNEWRNTVIDIISKLATREEVTAKLDAIYRKIEELEQFKNSRLETPGDVKALQLAVSEIKDWMNRQEGKASQMSVNITLLIAVLGLVITVIRMVFKV